MGNECLEFKVVQKKDHNTVYAAGFYTFSRAWHWLDRYDPDMWMDKTVQRGDLVIVPTGMSIEEARKVIKLKYDRPLTERESDRYHAAEAILFPLGEVETETYNE